jgi:radical SAM superfamily enzyme YgiQ (UPF0313 family)
MRLYLINPSNPLVSIVKVKKSRWNRYRVWKPLSLMVLAALTPSEWEISILDENLGVPDYGAMPRPDLGKEWVAQASINFADDEELLTLAAKAGCRGVFIGFETPSPEGMRELGKKFNLLKGRDFRASVRRIQRHHILVVGSFIIGLDVDEPGIGKRIAEVARWYGVDNLNALFLTPLPGTRLWDQMKSEDRIALDTFPGDWKYYTRTFPVARYKHLSLNGIIEEMISCDRDFYSMPRILRRVWRNLRQRREPLISLVGNLSYRRNLQLNFAAYEDFKSAVNPNVA